MTDKPLTRADIEAFACPDCPADIHVVPSISGVTGKPVPVVTVRHHDTCPWATRYVGVNGATITASMGILIHHRGIDDRHHRGIDDSTDTPPSTDTPDAA